MQPKSIKCFQCYSLGKPYLLTASSIKAIIPLRAYYDLTQHNWHLGNIQWEQRHVPVINLAGQAPSENPTPHSHIMIVQCICDKAPAFVAFLIAQMARPLNVTPNDLEFVDKANGYLVPVRGDHVVGEIVDIRTLSEFLREHHLIDG